jgi:hypothetical protein
MFSKVDSIPSLRDVPDEVVAALNEVGLANILQQLNAKIACSFHRGYCKHDNDSVCRYSGKCEHQQTQATSAV